MTRALIMSAALAAAEPAAFMQGILPAQPSVLVGGGEVLLEVAVEATGAVSEIRTLRATPPYTDRLRGAVKDWKFEPARTVAGVAVPSRVLVGGFYGPAIAPGPGFALGEGPRDVAAASDGVPFPTQTVPGLYPPLSFGPAQVFVELSIATDGAFTAEVVGDTIAPFRETALRQPGSGAFGPCPRPRSPTSSSVSAHSPDGRVAVSHGCPWCSPLDDRDPSAPGASGIAGPAGGGRTRERRRRG